jgi:hypothetical protein
MAYFNRAIGPTSAKKKRAGKSRGYNNKQFNINDFDKESCHFGIVENTISKYCVAVRNLEKNNLVHCTTHKRISKMFDKGCPVVFSYIRNDTTGEVITKFSFDELEELCSYFGVGYETVCRMTGTENNNVAINIDRLNDLKISSVSENKLTEPKNKVVNVVTIPDEYFDQLSDNDYEEKQRKVDKFGNDIDSDDEVDNHDEVIINCDTEQIEHLESPDNTIDVVTTETVDDDEIISNENKLNKFEQYNISNIDKRSKKKEHTKKRSDARSNKLSFVNANF